MARIYPPVPRFDLADPAFDLVVALEEVLDDSYLVLQPRAQPGREAINIPDPVVVLHPTAGVLAIWPYIGPDPQSILKYVNPEGSVEEAYATYSRRAKTQAEKWLYVRQQSIVGIAYVPNGRPDPGLLLSGSGANLGAQVVEVMDRIKSAPTRPTPEELDALRQQFLGGDRLTAIAISPLQGNYRDCKGAFAAMRAEHRGERPAATGQA